MRNRFYLKFGNTIEHMCMHITSSLEIVVGIMAGVYIWHSKALNGICSHTTRTKGPRTSPVET
jgi:hypothetical protein